MKDDSVQQTMSFSAPSSIDSRDGGRFRDFIKKSRYVILRDDLLRFFSYVYSISSESSTTGSYVSILRLLQFLGPALCLPFREIWDPNGQDRPSLLFLSFLVHFIPIQYRDSWFEIFSYSIIIILVGVLLSVGYFSNEYKVKSSIPLEYAKMINIFFLTIAEILPSIVFQMVFEKLSKCIFVTKQWDIGIIILISSALILVLLLILIQYRISLDGLYFRPASMMTLMVFQQNQFRTVGHLITIFLAFSTYSSLKMKLGSLLLAFFVYIYGLRIPYLKGGFVDNTIKVLYISATLTGMISCIFCMFLLNYHYSGRLIHIFMVLVFLILFHYIAIFIVRRGDEKSLLLLDSIDENQSVEMISSPNQLLNAAICGYRIAHPSCMSWRIFRSGVEKWNSDVYLWYAFAKFIVIYPEENQTVSWIYSTVCFLKLKGYVSKTLKMGLKMIIREREYNISPLLKSKLNSISKDIQNTKHKLRRVWDMTIQGNIGEIEQTTKRAFLSIEKNNSKFLDLFYEFPNNRFVTRAYSRFLFEIIGNKTKGNEMGEKTKRLSRGEIVTKDKAHDLGLNSFPLLPNKIVNTSTPDPIKLSSHENFSTGMNDFELELANENDKRDSVIIQERVDTLEFPSINRAKAIRWIQFLLFFICMFIGVYIFIETMYQEKVPHLKNIYHVSLIGQYLTMATGFCERYILQSLNIIQESKPLTSELPISIGSSWDIQKQISFLLRQISILSQEIEGLRSYGNNITLLSNATGKIFNNELVYFSYKTATQTSITLTNIQNAFGDYLIQLEKVSRKELSNITYSDLNSTMILNPIRNLAPINTGLESSLDFYKLFITTKNKELSVIVQKYFFVTISSVFFFDLLFLYFSLKSIRTTKTEVYKCLTTLPKNTVSSLSESLRQLKKEGDGSSTSKDNELSKQEENILKVFSSASSGENSSSETIIISSGTVFSGFLNLVCIWLFYELFLKEMDSIDENIPHIQYLHNSYTSMFSAVSMINHFSSFFTPYHIIIFNLDYIINQIQTRLIQGLKYFHLSWFGGRGDGTLPFLQFDSFLNEGNKATYCYEKNISTGVFIEELACRPVDSIFNLVQPYLQRKMTLYNSMNATIGFDDNITRVFWDIMLYPVFDQFFAPMSQKIVPAIISDLLSERQRVVPVIGLLTLLAFILEFIIIGQINKIEKHMRYVLSLLQHCPTHIVMQTPKIVSILSGNISSGQSSSSKINELFYDEIFDCLPDSVLVTNMIGEFEVFNLSFKRFFGSNLDNIKNLSDFLKHFKGDFTPLASMQNNGNTELSYVSGEDIITFQVNSFVSGQKYIVAFTDISQTVRYNKLICEEREKSDKLLSSILPPTLVKRVQQGESNISFSVQSVTIVFIDIVEFTPWCGSVPANTVMTTLNTLFKVFDSLIGRFSTMTKIKCIGDCYMAAGGVFSEVNHPPTHAKEAVEFGLEAINAIEELNQKNNIKLQIRIGINTGGPIVGGVLGIGKPTFEILGPAINLAQQMEHHGVPMNIHISRSVYELIYGNTFKIKERGNVEIKGGTVFTYLVMRN